MLARKLREEEIRDAVRIAKVCFHGRVEKPEDLEPGPWELNAAQWAAFTDEGRMMGRMQNNHFRAYFDGAIVENGGIGGVATLPEYRESGAVREIFTKLLPDARENGEVISTLYPFSHAFYRKFGYETVVHQNVYEMTPDVLREYRFNGTAELYHPGRPVTAFTKLYNEFAAGRNLAFFRDDPYMEKEWLSDDPYQKRCFSYLLSENGEPVSYVIFQDIRHDPQAILQVEEAVFRNREGFLAILGFLGRFSADYGTIRLPLPTDIDLLSVIHSPKSYEIKKTPKQDYMIRVINAEKLLSLIRMPEGERFVIRVEDELLPENTGTYRVTGGKSGNLVEPSDSAADIRVSERALGQIACGAAGLTEAALRTDVEIFGKEELLRRVFCRKPLYIMDHF